MPSFRGQKVNRGHAPAGGRGSSLPLPNPGAERTARIKGRGVGALPPVVSSSKAGGSAPSSGSLQPPRTYSTPATEHRDAMNAHSSAIKSAQETMKNNPRGSKAHDDADNQARFHRDKMDQRQKEWDSPKSVMQRAKAPKNG